MIVENDQVRIDAFQSTCELEFAEKDLVVFTNAVDAIAWLEDNVPQVWLILLDFNLGTSEESESGKEIGTGGDVAEWLAQNGQPCPVILHTDAFRSRPLHARIAGFWRLATSICGLGLPSRLGED